MRFNASLTQSEDKGIIMGSGVLSLCVFFGCTKILKKGFSPVLLIVILFILCVILEMAGILVI